MDNALRCPHCNSLNFAIVGDSSNLNKQLFIGTCEISPEGNKIYADNGFAMNGYVCRDCKIVTLTIPNA